MEVLSEPKTCRCIQNQRLLLFFEPPPKIKYAYLFIYLEAMPIYCGSAKSERDFLIIKFHDCVCFLHSSGYKVDFRTGSLPEHLKNKRDVVILMGI